MNISPEITERLETARLTQETYTPGENVARELGSRSLWMFVAPAAEGKSYIMNTLARLDSRIQPAGGFTTRPREERDGPDTRYRFIPHDDENLAQLLDDIDNKEVAQYIVHPTTGYVYGTYPHDYTSEFSTLDALSGAVKNLRTLPFRDTRTIGIVSRSEDWQAHFLERYPEQSSERTKRLIEARTSLEWLDNQPDGDVTWLFNDYDDADERGRELIDRIHRGSTGPGYYGDYAIAMLRRANLLK